MAQESFFCSPVFCFFCNWALFHVLLICADVALFVGIGLFGLFIPSENVFYSVMFSMPFATAVLLTITIIGLCVLRFKHQYCDICFAMAALTSMFSIILAGNLYANGMNGLAAISNIRVSRNVSVSEIYSLSINNGTRGFSWQNGKLLFEYTGKHLDSEGVTYFAVPLVTNSFNSTNVTNHLLWLVDSTQESLNVSRLIEDKPFGFSITAPPRSRPSFELAIANSTASPIFTNLTCILRNRSPYDRQDEYTVYTNTGFFLLSSFVAIAVICHAVSLGLAMYTFFNRIKKS